MLRYHLAAILKVHMNYIKNTEYFKAIEDLINLGESSVTNIFN